MSVRDKAPAPDVVLPLHYLLFRWRKEMNASWQQMVETPWLVIQRDLDYMDLEGEFLQPKESS